MTAKPDKPKRRWDNLRLSLAETLLALAALPVSIGFVVAVDELAYLTAFVYLGEYPLAWGFHETFRSTDLSDGVRRHLGTLDSSLPGWLVLGVTGLTVGLVRSRTLHMLFWFLPVSMIWFELGWWSIVEIAAVFGVILCWLLGWILRGHKYCWDRQVWNVWLQRLACSVALSLFVFFSSYGWFRLHDRDDALPSQALVAFSGILFAILPTIPLAIVGYDCCVNHTVSET